jgi:F-type H+-transporting ATPase subunit gamma
MPSLKDIRKRIQSVEGICKITSAMSMMSSSKLHTLQLTQESSAIYADRFQDLALSLINLDFCPEMYKKPTPSTLWIIMTTDQGFCGTFVSNIIKKAKENVTPGDEIWCFGDRGKQFCQKAFSNIAFYSLEKKMIASDPFWNDLAKRVIEKLKTITTIKIICAHMKNIMTYPIGVHQLFPLIASDSLVEFEPKDPSVIDQIMHHYTKSLLFSKFAENAACEHAARMISMDLATKNTKKLIESLRLRYNKARQSIITDEIVEIVAGADGVE